jgi:hypothetical protein
MKQLPHADGCWGGTVPEERDMERAVNHKAQADRWYRSYLKSQQRCENEEIDAAKRYGDVADIDLAKNKPYERAKSDRERDIKMTQLHALMSIMYMLHS